MLRLGIVSSLLVTLLAAQRQAVVLGIDSGQTQVDVGIGDGSQTVAWSDFLHVSARWSVDGGGSWAAAVPVDRSSSCFASDLQLAQSGEDVFFVWTGASQCDMFGPVAYQARCQHSDDRGATWLAADAIVSGVASSQAFRPQLAAVGSKVFVVWEDLRDGPINVYFNRSLDGGATWLPVPRRLDTDVPGAAISARPRIAASSSALCVTWMDYRHGAPAPYANRSLDDGATWLASDVRLNTGVVAGPSWAAEPEVTIEGLTATVVWRDARHAAGSGSTAADADIYANRSLDGGSTWLAGDVRIGPGAVPGAVPCLEARVAGAGGAVHVTWRDQRAGAALAWDVYANRSSDGGATWLGEQRLNASHAPGAVFSMMPEIAASPEVVAVVWQARPVPGQSDLFGNRSVDGGATWLPAELRLDSSVPGATAAAFAAVAARGHEVRAAWSEAPAIVTTLPFGFVRYGAATPGTAGLAPRLDGSGLPVPNGLATLALADALADTVGVWLVGAGPGSRVALPALGGTVLVDPFATVLMTTAGGGDATLPLPIPPIPALVGANVNCQALLLDPGAAAGFAFSNGVEVWIG